MLTISFVRCRMLSSFWSGIQSQLEILNNSDYLFYEEAAMSFVKFLQEYSAFYSGNLQYESLMGANLSGFFLPGVNLRGVNLRNADLSFSTLCYADFTGANLISANLSGANLAGANFKSIVMDTKYHEFSPSTTSQFTNIEGADFSGAILHYVDLRQAFFQDANFCGADLTLTLLPAKMNHYVRHDDSTKWPEKFLKTWKRK